MKTKFIGIGYWFVVLLISVGCTERFDGTLSPENLRCEYLIDPSGIDITNPRLSWYSVSEERNQKQTAYRILVSSSLEKLNSDKGDLWDSKKVDSDESIHIIYNGKELHSEDECFWKVKVWDGEGKESAWSEPAKWSMGLLNKTDWEGYWIGLDSLVGMINSSVCLHAISGKNLPLPKKLSRQRHTSAAWDCSNCISTAIK